MQQFTITQIGTLKADEQGFRAVLDKRYASALEGLEGFSHVNLIWWFSECDDPSCRESLCEKSPYRNGPGRLGVFATRSPMRPNPVALSCAEVTYIDLDSATIGLAYTDADDGSPLLDIKPYTPSLDKVDKPAVPGWCAHWPKCAEASGSFDWGSEFNF